MKVWDQEKRSYYRGGLDRCRAQQSLPNNYWKLESHSNPFVVQATRLKSRNSWCVFALNLGETDTFRMAMWNKSDQGKNAALPLPSEALPPGADLPRRQWVALNRARAKVAKTRDNMCRWGFFQNEACQCGEDPQTIEHILHI